MEKKIQGYYTLIEAGHSPEKIMPNLTLTKFCQTDMDIYSDGNIAGAKEYYLH